VPRAFEDQAGISDSTELSRQRGRSVDL
jgi:hypothetical protein